MADFGLAIFMVFGMTSRAPVPFFEHRRTIPQAPAPFFEHQRTIPRAPIPFLEHPRTIPQAPTPFFENLRTIPGAPMPFLGHRRTIKTVLPERSCLGLTIGGPSKQYSYVGFCTFHFSDLDKKMGAGFGRFRACDFYRLGEDLPQAPAPFIEHQRTSSRAPIPKFDDRRPSHSQLHKSLHIRGPSPEHPYHFLNI